MILTVEFAAQLRVALGTRELRLELPDGATLELLVERLREDRPGFASRALDVEGQLSRSVLVFVDGAQAPRGADLPLTDGQSVLFTSPIAGG